MNNNFKINYYVVVTTISVLTQSACVFSTDSLKEGIRFRKSMLKQDNNATLVLDKTNKTTVTKSYNLIDDVNSILSLLAL